MRSFSKAKKIAGYVLIAVIIAIIIVIIIYKMTGNVPVIFGYSLYVVVTPSMEPELSVGDVILSKVYKTGSAPSVGDIITYKGTQGSLAGKLITHKIISIEEDNGNISIIAKGIANEMPDPPIAESDIISTMMYKTYVLSFIHKILDTPIGFILLYIVPVCLFLAAEASDLLKLFKNRKEKINDEDKKDL